MIENSLPKDVIRYLDNYAAGNWKIEWNTDPDINCGIVIPAIMEYENIKKLISCLLNSDPEYFKNILILFVINNKTSSSIEIKTDNQKSIVLLRSIIEKKATDDFTKQLIDSGIQIGLIDASSEGKELPEKEGGVGLARKIGMDLCLKIFNYNSPFSKLLVCLDADCKVDKNYLAGIQQSLKTKNLKAGYFNFRHQIEGEEESKFAIVCYEIFLRYYVLGLKFACSPYAFHTIGSTMICSYDSYIKTEGMNKRKAAEDFYFLEKLAKNFPITKIESATVYPSGRSSWRVPFGTGQRVTRFLAKDQNEYLLYSTESFRILKLWLNEFNNPTIKSADEYLKISGEIHPSLYGFLIEQKFEENWKRILSNSKSPEQIQKQKTFWFDGFRTLKLIHHLRDNGFPQINMFQAADNILSEFNQQTPGAGNNIPSLSLQIEYLEILRKLA